MSNNQHFPPEQLKEMKRIAEAKRQLQHTVEDIQHHMFDVSNEVTFITITAARTDDVKMIEAANKIHRLVEELEDTLGRTGFLFEEEEDA